MENNEAALTQQRKAEAALATIQAQHAKLVEAVMVLSRARQYGDRGRIETAMNELFKAVASPPESAPAAGETPDAVKIAEWPVLHQSSSRLSAEVRKIMAATLPERDRGHPHGQLSSETACDFAARLLAELRKEHDDARRQLAEAHKHSGDCHEALGLLSTLKGDFETPRLLDDPVGSAQEIHAHVAKQLAAAPQPAPDSRLRDLCGRILRLCATNLTAESPMQAVQAHMLVEVRSLLAAPPQPADQQGAGKSVHYDDREDEPKDYVLWLRWMLTRFYSKGARYLSVADVQKACEIARIARDCVIPEPADPNATPTGKAQALTDAARELAEMVVDWFGDMSAASFCEKWRAKPVGVSKVVNAETLLVETANAILAAAR